VRLLDCCSADDFRPILLKGPFWDASAFFRAWPPKPVLGLFEFPNRAIEFAFGLPKADCPAASFAGAVGGARLPPFAGRACVSGAAKGLLGTGEGEEAGAGDPKDGVWVEEGAPKGLGVGFFANGFFVTDDAPNGELC